MTNIETTVMQPQLSESQYLEYLAEIARGTSDDVTRYRHYFVAGPEGTIDATQDGDMSCAWFVSNVLRNSKLAKRARTTVFSTVESLREAGWDELDPAEAVPGSVVYWPTGGSGNAHVGFYVGGATGKQYVSNSYVVRGPVRHGEALLDGRIPESIYAIDALRTHMLRSSNK